MRREEIAAFGELAGEAAAGAARQIHELHLGIAGRVWSRVGLAALPVKLAHDRIARSAYSAATELTRSIERAPAGRVVVSALNGAFGDTLVRRGNPLALGMTVRRKGRDVEITRSGL